MTCQRPGTRISLTAADSDRLRSVTTADDVKLSDARDFDSRIKGSKDCPGNIMGSRFPGRAIFSFAVCFDFARFAFCLLMLIVQYRIVGCLLPSHKLVEQGKESIIIIIAAQQAS